eukprot:gnl/Spiro4/6437_TR3301_c0_g1_i1.p1 gnl/Spiro4/6437_TR3301_c0_g1~~gnl/Spiro4/6437_TR3301_c0_g1_i1.p1  ORF type:complete len:565 (-),score=118.89 gnl/Spiro4/6437_TR3301_c0_g1_i1:452-2146(-)
MRRHALVLAIALLALGSVGCVWLVVQERGGVSGWRHAVFDWDDLEAVVRAHTPRPASASHKIHLQAHLRVNFVASPGVVDEAVTAPFLESLQQGEGVVHWTARVSPAEQERAPEKEPSGECTTSELLGEYVLSVLCTHGSPPPPEGSGGENPALLRATTCRRLIAAPPLGCSQAGLDQVAVAFRDFVRNHLLAPYRGRASRPPQPPARVVVFRLMHENAINGSHTFTWTNFSNVLSTLRGFVELVRPITELSLTSQVQYFAPVPPCPSPSPRACVHTPKSFDLGKLRGSVEWGATYLGGDYGGRGRDVLPLNVAVLVPVNELYFFQREQSEGAGAEWFVVPDWGPVCVHNPPASLHPPNAPLTGVHPELVSVPQLKLAPLPRAAMACAVRAFVTFIREQFGLVGIPRIKTDALVHVEADSRGISEWELDAVAAAQLAGLEAHTTHLLRALLDLRQVSSFTLTPVAAEDLTRALETLQQARSSVQLSDALHLMTRAHDYATRVYFDPKAQTPNGIDDSYLYGVYVPLFLPVLVTLCSLVVGEVKHARALRAAGPPPPPPPAPSAP